MTTLPDRLQALITAHLDCAALFSWEAGLRALGADSLDRVELAMAIEEAFGVSVPEGSEFAWRTAGDLLAVVVGEAQHV